ncbi:MAG: hypothetical protein ABI787_09490 [Spartobacteria bacterium]
MKDSVIAPGNGCEHFAQKGGRMGGAFPLQSTQRYSADPTGPEQTAQKGG